MELLSTERNIHLNKTCFALIFTRAECNHLHARWRREGSKNRTLPPRLQEEWPKHQRFLSEVDIKVAPFDVIFDIETFLPFVKMIARPMSLNMPQVTPAASMRPDASDEAVWGMGLNNNTLPLLYLKARTIRLFLPTRKNPESFSQFDSDFLLCHCESVSLSPQVDNPVSRILVKPDVYHLSQPILDVPGSQVENRQYQFDLKGVGLFTGKNVVHDYCYNICHFDELSLTLT